MNLNNGPHIIGLRERVEELEEEVADLRALLAVDESADWLMKAGFSPAESRMLSMLLAKEIVTRQQLLYASCPTFRRHEINTNQVSVQLHHINRKLKPLGIATASIFGRGVYLTPEAKAVLLGLKNSLERRQAAE